jgi:hypothetical protein
MAVVHDYDMMRLSVAFYLISTGTGVVPTDLDLSDQ